MSHRAAVCTSSGTGGMTCVDLEVNDYCARQLCVVKKVWPLFDQLLEAVIEEIAAPGQVVLHLLYYYTV